MRFFIRFSKFFYKRNCREFFIEKAVIEISQNTTENLTVIDTF